MKKSPQLGRFCAAVGAFSCFFRMALACILCGSIAEIITEEIAIGDQYGFMRKLLACFVVLAMLLCQLSLFASAAGDAEKEKIDSVEIVLLLDVSGSMKDSDPVNAAGTRVSIEAAQQFVFNYPTEKDMYVKVIPYNTGVCDGLESLNVSTEAGLRKYIANMQLILEDRAVLNPSQEHLDVLPGIDCWLGFTNIGGAMEAAADFLANSKADKHAVILFTDGKIDLGDKDLEVECREKAYEGRDALEEMGIPVYCVGLNANKQVDEEFLRDMSDSDVTEGKTTVVTTAGQLTGVFQEIYTYLFEDSLLDTEMDEIVVSPDVVEEKDLRIYGQAVREANLSLVSSAPLRTLKVTAPSGVVVADVDYTKNKYEVDSRYCVINATSSYSTVTVKLLNPMDGDWKLSITGEKSTVMISKIYLFDLVLRDSIEAETLFVGDVFNFDTTIYNAEHGTHVSSAGLYEGEDGAVASVNVLNTTTGESRLYSGKLNDAKNGYNFSVDFSAPGVYEFEMTIKHSQFKIDGVKTVTVLPPQVGISHEDGKISVSVLHPVTGEPLTQIPAYLNGVKGVVTVKAGEEVLTSAEFYVSGMENGVFSIPFETTAVGEYTASAVLSGYDVNLESSVLTITIDPSTITMKGELPEEITHSGLSADFSETISLKNVFKDSDGDDLTYTVKVSGKDVVSAKLDGNDLIITGKGFGSAKITITATDGNGAQATFTIRVVSESMMGLVIVLGIVVLVLVAAVVIFLVIVNKRKVIRFGFRVKVVKNDEGEYTEAVFNVGKLNANKNAKPTMALDTLLSSQNSFAQLIRSDFEDAALESLVSLLNSVTVTGQPFQRAFNVVQKGKKKGVFAARRQVRLDLAEIGCTVIFGTVNDFNDTDSYGF